MFSDKMERLILTIVTSSPHPVQICVEVYCHISARAVPLQLLIDLFLRLTLLRTDLKPKECYVTTCKYLQSICISAYMHCKSIGNTFSVIHSPTSRKCVLLKKYKLVIT